MKKSLLLVSLLSVALLPASLLAGFAAQVVEACDRPLPPPDGARAGQAGGPLPQAAGSAPMGTCPSPAGPGGDRMPPPPRGGDAKLEIRAATIAATGTATWRQRSFETRVVDTSNLLVTAGARLTLEGANVVKAGDTSSVDASSFNGQNAALLANEGGILTLRDSRILSSGSGANGVFVHGRNSQARLQRVDIRVTGDNAHGVMVAGGGMMKLDEVSILTMAQRSAAIATDRGGGAIDVAGGVWRTTGRMSPVLYATGTLNVIDGEGHAEDAEAAVIEGSNTINLRGTRLFGARNGAMIYQSFSGDVQGQQGRLTMRGGALTVASGPVFLVTNTRAEIELASVEMDSVSGVLLDARADRWGRSGENGGHARLAANTQTLRGKVQADRFSDVALRLGRDAVWTGSSKGAVSLALEANARWELDADSELATLSGADCSETGCRNIVGHGYRLRYDPAANPWARGRRYLLADGGELLPAH